MMMNDEREPAGYRARHVGDERWMFCAYDPRKNVDGSVNPDIEAEPLFAGAASAAACDLRDALAEVIKALRQDAPGTPLNNHKYVQLGIQASNALAKAGVYL